MKKIRIAHLADVHIRPHHYLDEMSYTFDKLFESLDQKGVDLVVICGDFFHSKLTVSSEYFNLAFSFLKKMSQKYDCIIIPGNHDSALSNQGRLDAITPVVNAVNEDSSKTKKLIFSKISESFSYSGVGFPVFFHHFCIYDEKAKWPSKHIVDENFINIALYHGAINNCIVDNGWISRGNRDDVSIFDGFDFAFLGDIHKAQYLDKEKTIAYPGSLRQNNFGEDLEKGYILWEIGEDGSHTSENVVLDQKRYFFTFYANKPDDLRSLRGEIPEDCRIRVKTTESLSLDEEVEIKKFIVENFKPHDEVQILPPDEPIDLINSSVKVGNLDVVHENIRDIDVQKSLIQEYLSKKNATAEEIEEVLKLDKLYHSSVDSDVLRNVVFNPVKLKWDNFFSYGKGNQINFSNIGNGLIGIFGNTGSGKSSIFDILFFSLFNSIYKEGANKNGDYVNRKCKRADSHLEMSLNNSKFIIERGIKKNYTDGRDEPKVENLVDFYKKPKCDANSLNGETGPDTNKFIRDTFGTKEDAEMLSHCSQFGLTSFIDAKGTKRKEILSRFFDLNVFDFKFDLASKDHKEIKFKLKDCNKTELIKQKFELESEVAQKEGLIEKNKEEKQSLADEKTKLSQDIAVLLYKKDQLPKINISSFDYKKHEAIKNELEKLEASISADSEEFSSLSQTEINEMEKIYNEIYKIKVKLPVLQKQADLIEKIPSVEVCKTCCLAKDSFSAKQESDKIKDRIFETVHVLDTYSEYKRWQDNRSTFSKKEIEFIKIESDRVEFEKNKDLISQSKNLSSEISKLQVQLSIVADLHDSATREDRRFIEKIAELKAKLGLIEEKLKLESELVERDRIYNLYLDAMGKNGISYWIISKKLNLVTKLVNQILPHATSLKFSIEENEDDKSLKIFVADDRGRRPIELSSGGEKTLVSIALRAALWKICLLPKMPILILDESLVFLDQEKYDSVIKLLKYLLQEYFDKIFIISHNEDLKRVVDNSIYIQQNKGFSFVEVK